jgi:thymidylate kinase
MQGLILLDGPDCAGKTTLCGNIMEAAKSMGLRAVSHHLGKPEKGQAWTMHADALISYIEQMLAENVIVIADRHFLSEGIYGRGYRDGSEYPYTMLYMDMLFNRFCGLKVICCPPTEVVVETHTKMKNIRREEYDDGMDKIAKMYQDLWHSKVCPLALPGGDYVGQLTSLGGVQDTPRWYHYDWTKENVRDYAEYLLEELRIEQAIDPIKHLRQAHYGFNGTPGKHSILFVGDEAGIGNSLNIPFFTNEGSSEFLAKILFNLGWPAEKTCIANVNDYSGVDTVKTLSALCSKTIVMGRNAERTCRLEKIEFDAYVRHPRNARKFNLNDDTYHNQLYYAMGGK